MNKRVKYISIILMILSTISIFGALLLVVLPKNENAVSIENMYYPLLKVWKSYFLLPITIASVIYGVYYKRKGYKVKKNIVIGVIFSLLLFAFGSLGFINLGDYSTEKKYIDEVESKINFELPSQVTILKLDLTKGNQKASNNIYYKSESVVRITNDDDANIFIEKLENDNRWAKSILEDIKSFIPMRFYFETKDYDYFMLYCIEDNSFNSVANDNNKNYIYLAYDMNNEVLILKEFSTK